MPEILNLQFLWQPQHVEWNILSVPFQESRGCSKLETSTIDFIVVSFVIVVGLFLFQKTYVSIKVLCYQIRSTF